VGHGKGKAEEEVRDGGRKHRIGQRRGEAWPQPNMLGWGSAYEYEFDAATKMLQVAYATCTDLAHGSRVVIISYTCVAYR